jgi:uncharacterized damage-inducible protein DinB
MVLPQDQLSLIHRSSQRQLIGRLGTLEGLKQVPDQLRRQIAGLSEDQLRRRPADDAWSIKEVCAHLRDSATVTDQRIHMMLTQSIPKLPPLDAAWVREREAQDEETERILQELRAARDRTVERLENLADANWARTGYHPSDGHLSIRQLCERVLAHERAHLDQIRAIIDQAL